MNGLVAAVSLFTVVFKGYVFWWNLTPSLCLSLNPQHREEVFEALLLCRLLWTCAHDILEPFIKDQYFICMIRLGERRSERLRRFIAPHNEGLQYTCAVHHYDGLEWIRLWKCIALCCREKHRSTLLFCFQTHIIHNDIYSNLAWLTLQMWFNYSVFLSGFKVQTSKHP